MVRDFTIRISRGVHQSALHLRHRRLVFRNYHLQDGHGPCKLVISFDCTKYLIPDSQAPWSVTTEDTSESVVTKLMSTLDEWLEKDFMDDQTCMFLQQASSGTSLFYADS